MEAKRYRQLPGLLVALVLPSIAIAWLGWQVLAKQRDLDEEQTERERRSIAAQIGADVRDRLNRLKAQEILASGSAANAYSDPAVVLVAWAEGGKLVLPWESPEPGPEPFRRAAEGLGKIQDDVLRLEASKQPGQAAKMLRDEMQKPHVAIERDYLRILLAGILRRWEDHAQEAADLYVELLQTSSDTVDDASKPQPLWRVYAANVLIEDRIREREILTRIEQDLDSFSALARWNVSLRDLLGKLRQSRDLSVIRRAEADLELLDRRMERLEQLRRLPQLHALQAAFQVDLGVTTENWPSFAADDLWFVGTGPQSGTRALVVAVRAEDIRKSVEAERRASVPAFRFALGGDEGYALGDTLPKLKVIFDAPPSGDGSAARYVMGLSLQQWFYALSLALVLGLTFFGAHLLWRDTRRELRIAELRSQFVSSVSHELKTPLTGIRMLAETLQMPGMADSQMHAEYLDTIVGETERLTRLLNNVLDFSKIERGQKNYHMQITSLTDVLRSAARTMRFPLAEQGFEFHLEVSDDVPPLSIDRDAIEQAVLNLLSNAMKYSGENRVIDLRLKAEDGRARIEVVDRGIGIPPEERKRIFEKFYRVQTPENRAISGTGLGLALVAHIVEAHGGSIEVESAVGKGSTFAISLPITFPTSADPVDTHSTVAGAISDAANRSGGGAS
jgi:signal transduction histidine kinase